MNTMEDNCIFCKIVKGEIPSYKVYEDENFFGFLDIYPKTKGHALLIPKKHYRWVYDVPNFGEYWESSRNVSKRLMEVLKPEFIAYLTHGMDVPHAHIHIIPRYNGDTELMPKDFTLTKEEIEEIYKSLQ